MSSKIGKLITEDDLKKDAIHIAIAPAQAAEMLRPGQRINVINGMAVRATYKTEIGIVDPLLKDVVERGDRFWVFMLPDSVTDLKHTWSHPSFPEKEKHLTREDNEESDMSYEDDGCRGCY